MTRRMVVLAAFALLLALSAAGGVMAAPKRDLAAGTALFPELDVRVHINAQSGPSGEDARGTFRLEQGTISLGGSVTCLFVSGTTAIIGGTLEQNEFGAGGFLQFVQDNGSPGTSDQSVTFALLAEAPTTCASGPSSGFVVGRGNYVVHDAIVE